MYLCSATKQHLQSAAIATVMNIDSLSLLVRHLGNFWASLCSRCSGILSARNEKETFLFLQGILS